MGGGSSKQQENEDNKPKIQTPKNRSKNNSRLQSPHGDYNQSKFKPNNKRQSPNHYNQAELENNQYENQSENQNGNGLQSSNNYSPQYFIGWPQKFQKNDKVHLKIFMLAIEPTYQIKNLNKKCSEHQAVLTWQYEYLKKGKTRETFLRFYLNEDDGFSLTFLINEETNCIEGDQAIWKVICPFRTSKESQKVGTYFCERLYESNQKDYDEDNEEYKLDADIFYRWEEKPSASRSSMKRLLNKKRMIEDLKNQKGFEYSEITKYFDSNEDWAFSVLIEEKFNTFKSWIVELDPTADPKQLEKIKTMSITLRNDIQTRQSMYVEEMKKKSIIIQQSKPKSQ